MPITKTPPGLLRIEPRAHSLALAALLLCFAAPAASGQIGQVLELTTTLEDPRIPLAVDLNGDGAEDLVIIGTAPGTSVVFLSGPNGSMEPVQSLDTPAGVGKAMAADLDGDGRIDVAVSRRFAGQLLWFRNLGDGRLGDRELLLDVDGPLQDPALADLDGDGGVDVIAGRAAGVSIFFSAGGPGTFGAEVPISGAAGGDVRSLVLGDYDGDGDLDVAAGRHGIGGGVDLYVHLGAGAFAAASTLASDADDGVAHVGWGDINGDGELDLIVGWRVEERVEALLQNAGSFGSPIVLVDSLFYPPSTLLQDVNQDGAVDLVIRQDRWIYCSLQGGGLAFGPLTYIGESFTGDSSRIYGGDLNGDGLGDLVTLKRDFATVHTAAPGEAPYFEPERALTNAFPGIQSLIAEDLDLDGDLDILAAGTNDPKLLSFENRGGAELMTARPSLAIDGSVTLHDSGDLIGDAFPDALVSFGGVASRSFGIAQGAGDGTFGAPMLLFSYGSVSSLDGVGASLGDLDGDGDHDILVGDRFGQRLSWLENEGGGVFSGRVDVGTGVLFLGEVWIQDIDGDGVQDVAAIDGGFDQGMSLRWWKQASGGVFLGPRTIGGVTSLDPDPEFGDLDGDGDLDAVWTAVDALIWAENLGAATFAPAVVLMSTPPAIEELELLDVDVDGDLDLLLLPAEPSADGRPAFLVESLGGGQLGAAVPLSDELSGATLGAVADFDQDGAPDVIVGQPVTGSVKVAFGGASLVIGQSICGPAAANGAGLDGRITARGSYHVGENRARLIASRLPPGAFGFFLASETATVAMPVTGSQGLLCLGGEIGRFVLPGQVMQASGAGLFSLELDLTALPTPTGPVPALAGAPWAFQAWHRDVSAAGATSNFTDAIQMVWQ